MYYLSIKWLDGNRLGAVITDGCLQTGDKNVTVCDSRWFDTEDDAHAWFFEQIALEPWKVRS